MLFCASPHFGVVPGKRFLRLENRCNNSTKTVVFLGGGGVRQQRERRGDGRTSHWEREGGILLQFFPKQLRFPSTPRWLSRDILYSAPPTSGRWAVLTSQSRKLLFLSVSVSLRYRFLCWLSLYCVSLCYVTLLCHSAMSLSAISLCYGSLLCLALLCVSLCWLSLLTTSAV